MRNKLSAIMAILESEHYVVITARKQISCTPKNGCLKFWEFFDSLWKNQINGSRHRVVDGEEE